METSTQANTNSALVWIAIIMSALSLILAWVAYNRAGVDLEEQIEREVAEAVAEVDYAIEVAEDEAREETADALNEGAQELNEGAREVRTDENE